MARQDKKTAAAAEPGGVPHTRGETLRAILEAAIIKGDYLPGARLEEQELAERYRMSRTPVRETLRLLAATGLVEMRARQGAVVASLPIPKLIEMFQVMAELEGLCARLTSRRCPPQKLRQIEDRNRACAEAVGRNDPEAFYAADQSFHQLIYTASNSQFLDETVRALRNRISPYRRYVTYQPGRMLESVREHEAVLDAMRQGDAEAAHRLMRDHVNLLGDRFADFVSALPFGMAQDADAKRIA